MDSANPLIRWLKANRHFTLFCALLLIILMLPAFEDTALGEKLLALASIVIVVVCAMSTAQQRSVFWATTLIALAAAGLRLAAFADGLSGLILWSWVLTAVVLSITMVQLLRVVFSPGQVTRDKLFGCATVYLLIGVLWCFLYGITEELSPGSFTGINSSRTVRIADLVFFSFNIVTNVALTNGMPVSRKAQMLVLLQEFASVLYMAFVISRLVGMYAPAPAAAPAEPARTTQ